MLVAEKLSQEELDLNPNFGTDKDDIELRKQVVKNIVRYETDHFIINDPHKEDPIIISDSDIDANIDFFVSTYEDVLNIPYLSMDRRLKTIHRTRKSLKYNDLMLYTRKELAKVDLRMGDSESFFDMDFDNGDIIDLNKINKDEKDNKIDIIKTDGARLIVEYMIRLRYGGMEMSQIDLIVEQLEYDIKLLESGDDLNKDRTIKDINKAIDIIKDIGVVRPNPDPMQENPGYMDTEWYKYFIETIVYDARAVKIVREIDSKPENAKQLIDKIFGPEMAPMFIQRFKSSVKYGVAPSDEFISSASILMLYTLAKKIRSSMKSGSNRSLIYRGYIIHYMLDVLDPNQLDNMTNLFKDLYDLYLSNTKLATILKKNKFSSIVAASKMA